MDILSLITQFFHESLEWFYLRDIGLSKFLLLQLVIVLITAVGIVFGSSMFLFMPFLTLYFPLEEVIALMAVFKGTSVIRSTASTFITWEKVHKPRAWELLRWMIPGTILGVYILHEIGRFPQWIISVSLMGMIILCLISPNLEKFIGGKKKKPITIIIGMYAGILGAGIAIFLTSATRSWHYMKKDELAQAEIQSRAIEPALTSFAVIAHVYLGNMIWPLLAALTVPSFLGGYIGGKMKKKTLNFKSEGQSGVLYIGLTLAFIATVLKLIDDYSVQMMLFWDDYYISIVALTIMLYIALRKKIVLAVKIYFRTLRKMSLDMLGLMKPFLIKLQKITMW